MSEPTFLVCIYWGMQEFPSVQLRCVKCPEIVAMDARNQGLPVSAICPACFLVLLESADQPELGGTFVARRKMDLPAEIAEQIEKWARTVVANKKRAIAIASS